jgi:predicted site-specific integrase-resolvase
MAEKTYFSLPAAARELGVSTDLLRRQYRSGLVAAIKTPGGQPRFATETIEQIKQSKPSLTGSCQ